MVGDRVWEVPLDEFIAAWNEARTLDEVSAKVKELARGNVPRWAVMARATALRKDGMSLKPLTAAKRPCADGSP